MFSPDLRKRKQRREWGEMGVNTMRICLTSSVHLTPQVLTLLMHCLCNYQCGNLSAVICLISANELKRWKWEEILVNKNEELASEPHLYIWVPSSGSKRKLLRHAGEQEHTRIISLSVTGADEESLRENAISVYTHTHIYMHICLSLQSVF